MDFFKSVFSDDPSSHESPNSEHSQDPNPNSDSDPTPSWSFGGLIKTLASKSDSVIHHYRRDFEELGSGLLNETTVIREVASRAVKGLPATIEAGTSVAQESLESVGQAVDDIGASVWNSTTQIIAQGKERLLASDDVRDYGYTDKRNSDCSSSDDSTRRALESKLYNRFDVQLRAIQGDLDTYCKEPDDDAGKYEEWRSGFVVDEKEKEIEDLIEENPVIGEFYGRVVPSMIDREAFWARYFYKVHKLRQVEDARAKLINRAISEEEEDWSWDVDGIDDDEPKESTGNLTKGDSSQDAENSSHGVSSLVCELGGMNLGAKYEKASLEGKSDNDGSCKDSDVSVVSTQASLPVEELGWDEIEDMEATDENKRDATISMSRADLNKRLSAADEEEDLSWDIEDVDDEPN